VSFGTMSDVMNWLCTARKGGVDVSEGGCDRPLSLPKSVVKFGGLGAWNAQSKLAHLRQTMAGACKATTVEEALEEVHALASLGHFLWAYMYLRTLCAKDMNVYYGMLLADPSFLLPVAYTPTVGEACQKYGMMPLTERGCYVSITDRGNLKAVLAEYAAKFLSKKADGSYDCQCIVFSDGGRILGLGDLGAWGMGIPMGKLDLYTVCGGFNPHKTIPVIIDAGCTGSEGNSAKLTIRDHELYTGLKQERAKHVSAAKTEVNTAYYGDDSFIGEFMSASASLFGKGCLLQFEDFNSNDAFPLLEEYRHKFLSYNDDIQGTAAVAVAGILGGLKIQKPECTTLVDEARKLTFLFHGAGSANLGGASLLINEANVPASQVFVTNSRGLIWKSADGTKGSFRNEEQKAVAHVGQALPDGADLVAIVKHVKPDVIVGAVGRAPNCFTKAVMEAMTEVQAAKKSGAIRPIVFALSNPKTQAEITAADCYAFTDGAAIYGSGTRFEAATVNGKTREPGQVNNFFIFPGMSFGTMLCEATTIPESFFMVAAEAVANSLDAHDIEVESVVPHPGRIREVNSNVATAVVLAAQKAGLAGKPLGSTPAEVESTLKAAMWSPPGDTVKSAAAAKPKPFMRTKSDFGGLKNDHTEAH